MHYAGITLAVTALEQQQECNFRPTARAFGSPMVIILARIGGHTIVLLGLGDTSVMLAVAALEGECSFRQQAYIPVIWSPEA